MFLIIIPKLPRLLYKSIYFGKFLYKICEQIKNNTRLVTRTKFINQILFYTKRHVQQSNQILAISARIYSTMLFSS